MNRTTLLAVLLGVGVVANAQDLTRKITVEIPASRASVALAALAKASGVSMEPAANLRNEVFVINVHDATVDDVMKRVAEAESGKWLLQSGIYFLTRDSSTGVAQERAEIAARTSAISKAIAKLGGAVSSSSKFDKAAAEQLAGETRKAIDQFTQGQGQARRIMANDTANKTPATRAIARLLAVMDPVKLAQIGPNQRMVFSTQPTAMQHGLNGAAYAVLNQFVEEQQLFTQTYNANEPQDGTSRSFSINGLGNPSMGPGDPRLGLGLGLVIVERRFEGGLNFQFLAADTKLETLANGSYTLQLPNATEDNSKPSTEAPLQISDLAKELANAGFGAAAAGAGGPRIVRAISVNNGGGDINVKSMDSGDGNVKISAELKSRILNPEKFDPLSFAPGEAMLALSKQREKNLVALLPDYCFGSMNRQFAGKVTPTAFIDSLGPRHGLNSKLDGDWIVVSPNLPASARANAVDRSALGILVRSLDKNGMLHLDDLCNFALAQSKVPAISDADYTYVRLINGSAASREFMPLASGSYSLYRFYGSLSGPQRQSVASGQQISFMNLSSQQLGLVADMLYNSPQGPNVQTPQSQQPSRLGQQSQSNTFVFSSAQSGGQMPMVFGFGGTSALTERTIVVPNGVTNDGFLVGSIRTQQVAQGTNSQTGASSVYDPTNLAFSRNIPSQQIPGYTPPVYDRWRMAVETDLTIRFMFNPRVSLSRALSDTSLDASNPAGPYESLPADFRSQVQAAADQLKNAFQKAPGLGIGFGAGGKAPPPQ